LQNVSDQENKVTWSDDARQGKN